MQKNKDTYSREQSLHLRYEQITKKIEGLFHIIPFKLLRHTNKVNFHSIPYLDHVNAMDRVFHDAGAKSPGKVGKITEAWYMHAHQEDNLITMQGVRHVELYHPVYSKGKIEKFEISPDYIKWNGIIVLNGPGILGWPTGVYHRNSSIEGSASLNLGIRFDGMDLETEFNIYDVNTQTKEIKMVRKGSLDQPANL